MSISEKDLKSHAGANPEYAAGMRKRRGAQDHNREARMFNENARAAGLKQFMPIVSVPKCPNKYVPHYGAKESAKYAARGGL